MRFVNMFLCLVFLIFAALQWNDMDWFLWMAAYGIVAFAFFCAAFQSFFHSQTLFLVFLFMVWSLTYLPIVSAWLENGMPDIAGTMQAANPFIEYMREFFGLCISLAALLFLYAQGKREKHFEPAHAQKIKA